ncbi:MAG: 2TM domain-containing protein [Flavobacteriaceae bacterium]|nr:2TM domain-containing protein [Flavobacteriaceae bacterium]
MNDKDKIEQEKYLIAKAKVDKIKKFYKHLTAYIVVCSIITINGMIHNYQDSGEIKLENGTIWFFWGIGIFVHWLKVFGQDYILGKSWEKDKIKELMDKDKF